MPPDPSAAARYEIGEPLGSGGMGIVYRARDAQLDRPVALKRLPAALAGDPERRRRFLQEARAAAAVDHPALARVYDVGEDGEGIFIAMELVPGRTIDDLVRSGELDLVGAIDVGLQVATGLAAAHQAGIVHRDIKPSNVMVTPEGRAKILDFGLARMSCGPQDATEVSHLDTLARTQAGLVLGTAGYMSPEQARGLPADARSDIFSLGVLLYEMVAGRRAFSGATALDTLHAVAYEGVRPLSLVRPDVPPALARVVSRCLQKNADDRYRHCGEVVDELRAARREADSGISSGAGFFERVEERLRGMAGRGPLAWVLGVGAAAFLLAGGVLALETVARHFGLVFVALMAGLLVWRRARSRTTRLARRFADRARRLQGVDLIGLQGTSLLVVAHQPTAATYVRLRALVDALNATACFGDPLALVVREDMPEDERRSWLSNGRVLFLREAPPRAAE